MSKEELVNYLSLDKEWVGEAENLAEKPIRERVKELLIERHIPKQTPSKDRFLKRGFQTLGYLSALIQLGLVGQKDKAAILGDEFAKFLYDPNHVRKLTLNAISWIADSIEFPLIFDFYTECRDNEPEAVVEKWVKKVAIPAYIGAAFIASPADPLKEDRDEDKDLKPAIF